MSRSYKWVGGIGYLLSFIPYANYVSSIVVAVAWILMGRDTREKIFTATGILMMITFILGIGILVSIFLMMPLLISGLMMGETPFGFDGLSQLIALGILALILIVLAIVVVILEIVSHFRAGNMFGNTWFKVGGWLRIITIISAVISIPLIIINIISNITALITTVPGFAPGPEVLMSLLSLLWPLIIVGILLLLSIIFSIVAFFTIPEAEVPVQSQETLT